MFEEVELIEATLPEAWNASAVITVIEVVFLLLGIVAMLAWGYRQRYHNYDHFDSNHIAASPLVPWWALLTFRSVCGFVGMAVILYQFTYQAFRSHHPFRVYSYYTVWNFTLLTVYFVCSAVYTALARFRAMPAPMSFYFGNLLVVMFNVEAACVFLVDSVTWGLLLPYAIVNNDTSQLVNVESFIEHGLNGVVMMIDFAINNTPVHPFHSVHVLLWAGTYLVFSWIFYTITGIWRYPFLDIFLKASPGWYVLLAGGHVAYFFMVYGLYRLKCRLLQKYDRAIKSDDEEVFTPGI